MENSLAVPPKGYLTFPKPEEQKTKPGKAGIRYFYYGQILHDEYQIRKLQEYYNWVKKEKLKVYNDEYWTEQKTLLILGGNGYKNEKTYKAIEAHQKWRKDFLPMPFKPKFDEIFKKGFLYVSGRDYQFRPILVMNAKLIDYNIVEEFKDATIYAHEIIIRQMLLPGQIQNWIIIYDLGQMTISQIPIMAVKNVMQVISNNYGGRLFKMYIVNANSTINFGWKMASAILDDVTVAKISIRKESEIPEVFNYCDKSQIEKKYGGTQPDREVFWPLSVPDPVIKEQLLVTEEQYIKYYKQGKLSKNKLSPYIKL